jgi:serine/threonine-protein kinase RsbT
MVSKKVDLQIAASDDIVAVRQATRALAVEAGLSLIDQTKVVTAASELARNTLVYGGGGTTTVEIVSESPKQGLRLTFEDKGPGIPDLERAMQDGYSTGGGLGLGLGGSKRLSSEFRIESKAGFGTRVVIARWKG